MPIVTYNFFTCIVVHSFNGNAVIIDTEDEPILTVAEYRKLMSDNVTPDEHIVSRINFLVALIRKNVRNELDKICQK